MIDDRGNELLVDERGEISDAGYPEVGEPIQNSPFEKPTRYWYIREGEQPQLVEGQRRPSIVFAPREQKETWLVDERLLRPSKQYPTGFELALVNLIRDRVADWQKQGYPGSDANNSRTMQWWTREGVRSGSSSHSLRLQRQSSF